MRIDGLGPSLVFAAGVAIALVFAMHLAAPLLGSGQTLTLYLVAATAAYAGGLAATPRAALRNALVALLGGGIAAGLAGGIGGLAIGLTLVLGFVRSGLEHRRPALRALVLEGGLALLALGFAAWLHGPGWLGVAVALWGYALVQSLYFLATGARLARLDLGEGDPFERAEARLCGLLDEV